MKKGFSTFRKRGFTLVELIAVVIVIAVLAALLFPVAANLKAKSARIGCVNNLKNMGLAFRIWSTGNSDLYPMQTISHPQSNAVPDLSQYFAALANEIGTPKLLICPADKRRAATNFASLRNENISYFLALDTSLTTPAAFLMGDRNLLINGVPVSGGRILVTSNTPLSWGEAMHHYQGNILLGDGSAQQPTQVRLQAHAKALGTTTNQLIFP